MYYPESSYRSKYSIQLFAQETDNDTTNLSRITNYNQELLIYIEINHSALPYSKTLNIIHKLTRSRIRFQLVPQIMNILLRVQQKFHDVSLAYKFVIALLWRWFYFTVEFIIQPNQPYVHTALIQFGTTLTGWPTRDMPFIMIANIDCGKFPTPNVVIGVLQFLVKHSLFLFPHFFPVWFVNKLQDGRLGSSLVRSMHYRPDCSL